MQIKTTLLGSIYTIYPNFFPLSKNYNTSNEMSLYISR